MHTPARPLGEPIPDELGLVGSGVVEDEINIEAVGNIGLDGVEELAELLRPVAAEAAADDFADLHVQRTQ